MSESVRGIDIVLEVEDSAGEMIQVGGQRGATLNREGETLEATSKDTNGWRDYKPGFKEWSVDCDGVVIVDDEGYNYLEEAFHNDSPVQATVAMPSGTVYTGDTIVTSFPLEMPYDDLATYTLTLQGAGELKKE